MANDPARKFTPSARNLRKQDVELASRSALLYLQVSEAASIAWGTVQSNASKCVTFPLTPALSLGERESCCHLFRNILFGLTESSGKGLSSSKNRALDIFEGQLRILNADMWFPLPEGEGQGEGKGTAANQWPTHQPENSRPSRATCASKLCLLLPHPGPFPRGEGDP